MVKHPFCTPTAPPHPAANMANGVRTPSALP